VVVTADGRTASGLVAEESATSITLRRKEGVQETILRRDVEEFVSTGKSLMPEGLEKTVGAQELADLIAFITSHAARAGTTTP
jgi:putative heme-binding domain-containing protein